MADQVQHRDSRNSSSLTMIIGMLIAAVLVLGFFVFGGSVDDAEKDVNVKIETPNAGGGTGGGNTGGGNTGGSGQ